MSTYYKENGQTVYRIAAARMTYEKSDGTIGEVTLAGGGGGSTAWADITGKPAFIGAGSSAALARTAITAAASGANGDITSLTGLTTPLSRAQGGTGTNTMDDYKLALGIPWANDTLILPISALDNNFLSNIRALSASTTGKPAAATEKSTVVTYAVQGTDGQQVVYSATGNDMWLRSYNPGTSTWRAWNKVVTQETVASVAALGAPSGTAATDIASLYAKVNALLAALKA